MLCRVLKTFNRRGESQTPGTVLNIPEGVLIKLTGYVEPIATADSYPEPPEGTNPTLAIVSPTHCQAKKVGGRVCGSPLREGINGFLSCADPVCQVPAVPRRPRRC